MPAPDVDENAVVLANNTLNANKANLTHAQTRCRALHLHAISAVIVFWRLFADLDACKSSLAAHNSGDNRVTIGLKSSGLTSHGTGMPVFSPSTLRPCLEIKHGCF